MEANVRAFLVAEFSRIGQEQEAVRRKGEERSRARHGNNAVTVRDLASFDLPHLGRSIEIRRYPLDHFNRAHPMSDCHEFFRIHTVLLCPGAPVALYGTCGIHENPIEIKENRRAVKNWHLIFSTTGFGTRFLPLHRKCRAALVGPFAFAQDRRARMPVPRRANP